MTVPATVPFQVQPAETGDVAHGGHRDGPDRDYMDSAHDLVHDHTAGGGPFPERVLPVVRRVVPPFWGALGGDIFHLPAGGVREGLLQVWSETGVVHASPHEAQRDVHELLPLQLRVSVYLKKNYPTAMMGEFAGRGTPPATLLEGTKDDPQEQDGCLTCGSLATDGSLPRF